MSRVIQTAKGPLRVYTREEADSFDSDRGYDSATALEREVDGEDCSFRYLGADTWIAVELPILQ